jgi:dipeptidyl-peptidase-4
MLGVCRAEIVNPEFLEQYGATYRFTLGQPTGIAVTDAGDAVLFLRSGPRSFVRDLYEFDVATGKERLLLSAEQLLQGAEEELTAEERARRERMRLAGSGIVSFDVSRDGQRILVPLSGSLYVFDRSTDEVRELVSDAGHPIDARFSPDGRSVACARNGDLYVIDVATGSERRLTEGASETLTHGLAEFVAQEEMDRMRGYWWSPDSQQIVYQETDTSQVEEWHIADPANPASDAEAWRYPRPGKNNAVVRLGIVPVSGGSTTWIDWDREQFPYLARVAWEENAPLTLLVQNREQTDERLLAVDHNTGNTTELLRETDPAWINIDAQMPDWLDDGSGFLWSTERGGGWQLELHGRDGTLLRTLTPLELNYRSLIGIGPGGNAAIVAAGTLPTQVHLFRIPLEADSLTAEQITSEPGVHHAVISDKSGTHVRISHVAGGPRWKVYRSDGTLAGELTSVAETPPFAPNVELTVVGDEPRLHAAIVRPRNFRAGQSYPVVVSVYGGPHAQVVVADARRYLLNQWLADQGFIVVAIDGRGTPARGRDWERIIKGNFIELPLADQVRGLKALGAKYPELDLSRVGIYGWSFGGYFAAMAVMQRPDVFHAGVAGAPVVDWRDYDTHYTERYLGLPATNPQGYEASSVLTYAPQLTRPLLLIHGTADDNVYFLHSMKLCDELFRAGRPYEFLPLSGLTHMVPDPLVTRRLYERIAGYFLTHLAPGESPGAK